jgi:glucose/arabinose dehydrogenase
VPRAPRATGRFPYRPVSGWGDALAAAGLAAREFPDVSVGPGDRIHVLARNPSFVAVLDPRGEVLDSWRSEFLTERPHAITVGPDGQVYVVDSPAHVVRVSTRRGP